MAIGSGAYTAGEPGDGTKEQSLIVTSNGLVVIIVVLVCSEDRTRRLFREYYREDYIKGVTETSTAVWSDYTLRLA